MSLPQRPKTTEDTLVTALADMRDAAEQLVDAIEDALDVIRELAEEKKEKPDAHPVS